MKIISKYTCKRGQSIVEMAIILPILILILMSIIDFGLMFNSVLVINNASREGARSAAVGLGDSEITAMIQNVTSELDQDSLAIEIDPTEGNRTRGDQVAVRITYQNEMITPIISAIVGDFVELNAETVMRVE